MKTQRINKLILLLFLPLVIFLISAQAKAQNKPYNEEITVIATFDPIIPDAFKINQNPVVNDTSTAIPVMTYVIRPKDAGIQLAIEPLPAVKLVAEPLSKIYRNYLKAGLGNYSTIYGELFASSLRSKTHLLGFHARHISSSGAIKDYAPTTNSSQLAELYGERYLENHTLAGNLFFQREGLHLYGFKPDDFPGVSISKDDIKQRYLIAGTDLSISSRYKSDNRLNHAFGFSYYHLTDKYKAKENNYHIKSELNKNYDLFKWDKDQTLGLNTSLNIMNQKDSLGKFNTAILCINPTIRAYYQEYSFKAGIGFYVGMDTITKAHIYPQLEAKLDLIPGALQIYAGIDGGMERVSLKGLSDQNPYISSILPLNYTYNKFKAFGGFNSNISRSFNFNASIASYTVENNPFFVTDSISLLGNSFTLLYDDISYMKVRAELEFIKTEKLKLGLSGTYYDYYKLGDQEYAWYKPQYDLTFTTLYNMQDKIILKFQTTLNGPVYALVPDKPVEKKVASYPGTLDAEKIKGWVDVNLGAEYKFNKALSFWLNINNIANSQHFYWAQYPSYRINLLGGLSYSF
ncbi:MAG: hypothetical protein IPH45_17750 [Bacteroidales bacterium]|nr:hypothetical protein [Bacteroidales bacterium]